MLVDNDRDNSFINALKTFFAVFFSQDFQDIWWELIENEWDINIQTVIIVETELIVRNLLQHYGDERFKWFAHSRVGSPRILNQLGVFVDIKTRIGCPRPPLRTPQSLDASIQSKSRDADSEPIMGSLTFSHPCSLITSGQRGARVWRTSHHLPRDLSLIWWEERGVT